MAGYDIVQKTGSRQLTEEELMHVHTTKKSNYTWKVCSICGKLQFVVSNTKYCTNTIACGYKTLEVVEVEFVPKNEDEKGLYMNTSNKIEIHMEINGTFVLWYEGTYHCNLTLEGVKQMVATIREMWKNEV